MAINLLLIYGAGNDTLFGGGLRWLQSEAKQNYGTAIYSPRIVDYTEYQTIVRLLRQWNDPTIIVTHSCGGKSGTAAVAELSMERIPYMMIIAPSIYCQLTPLPPNVARATQATSNAFDFFNPGGRLLLKPSSINFKTKIDAISTGKTHLNAPFAQVARDRLLTEIGTALSHQLTAPER